MVIVSLSCTAMYRSDSFRTLSDLPDIPDTRLSEVILVKLSDESSEILNTWYKYWYAVKEG